MKCLGISRHAASAQLYSGAGLLLTELGQELKWDTAYSEPYLDTSFFCSNFSVHKNRTAITHVVPKGALRLTMAIDRPVMENLAQYWELLPSALSSSPSVTLISETSVWAETTPSMKESKT